MLHFPEEKSEESIITNCLFRISSSGSLQVVVIPAYSHTKRDGTSINRNVDNMSSQAMEDQIQVKSIGTHQDCNAR